MKRLGAVAMVIVFVAALFVLQRELEHVRLDDVLAAFRATPASAFGLALVLTLCSYLVLTGYDALALRYAQRPLPYPRVALTSFIAYAVGNNLGLALLTGGSVRYRLYSRAGLSAVEVGKVVAACTLAFALGSMTVMAVVCWVAPDTVTQLVPASEFAVRSTGAAVLLLVAVYALWNGLQRTPLEFGNVRLPMPGLRMTIAQLALATADMAVASAVLYVLLPAGATIDYPSFVGLYVVAIVAGIASNVPGGLGVFEAVLMIAVPNVAPGDLLAAVLAYRVLYYLLPLLVAAGLLIAYEFGSQRQQLARLVARTGAVFGGFAARIIGSLVFAAGAALLLSLATPAAPERLQAVTRVLPGISIDIAHLVASVTALALLLISHDLFLRVTAAHRRATWLLAAGLATVMVARFDWLLAAGLALVFGVLLVGRNEFARRDPGGRVGFAPGWFGAIALVLIGSGWLGAFSWKDIDLGAGLWWQTGETAGAARFLRSATLVGVLAVIAAISYLARPRKRREPEIAGPPELEHALPVIAASPRPEAWLALAGDKRLLFDSTSRAFVMYGVHHRTWVAVGDPVGPEATWEELVWAFTDMVDRHGGRPVFYAVDATRLPHYLELGLEAITLGEDAQVALADFSLDDGRFAALAESHGRAATEDLRFEVRFPPESGPVVAELDTMAGSAPAAGRRGFVVGSTAPNRLQRLPCASVRCGEKLVAFASLSPGANHGVLSVDVLRTARGVTDDAVDYLLVELALWARSEGYGTLSLGMAPLDQLAEHPLAPAWLRVGPALFPHGEHFGGFETLRAWKQRFDPDWQMRYLVTSRGLSAGRALVDVGALVAGLQPVNGPR